MHKKYPDAELEDYISVNIDFLTPKEISEMTYRNEAEVLTMIKKINATKRRKFKKFTDDEKAQIKKYYSYLTDSDFSKVFQRNRAAIHTKIKELSLSRNIEDMNIYQKELSGLEDTIMFLYTSMKKDTKSILDILKQNISTKLDENMIEAFIFSKTSEYKKKWKMFDCPVVN